MNELALFAGAGGGILGGTILGWRTVCAVEINTYAASVLVSRQNDGCLPAFPIWDDVCTFDGRLWRGVVDVVSGGFPCQDISCAGKGVGITGERSGLWREFARIIGEVRPRYVFVENSPALRTRGLAVVLGDLATLGFDAEWGVVSAADVGAPHLRKRMWIVAHHAGIPKREPPAQGNSKPEGGQAWKKPVGHTFKQGLEEWQGFAINRRKKQPPVERTTWWDVEPDVVRVVHGVAARVDRITALGNGQVPVVAATAWRILKARLDECHT